MKRVGFIGCNNVFDRHFEALTALSSEYRLVAVSDINKTILDTRSSQTGAHGFLDYREMIDTVPLDLVVIATPHFLHTEQALYAINKQVHVLIEKPAVIRYTDLDVLQTQAAKKKVTVSTVLQLRYNQTLSEARTIINENQLGELRMFRLSVLVNRKPHYFHSWFGDIEKSGGFLYDLGIHYLDFLIQVLNTSLTVESVQSYWLVNESQPDTFFITARTADNTLGMIEISAAAEPVSMETKLAVFGSRGVFEIGGNYLNKMILFQTTEHPDIHTLKSDQEVHPNANYRTLYRNLIEGRGISLEDSRPVLGVIDTVYKKVWEK